MGFLDGLLFFPSAKSSDKAPPATWSRSRSESSRRSDIVPLTPQTLEKEACPDVPKPLDVELARRLLGQDRDSSSNPRSGSEEQAKSSLDDAVDGVPVNEAVENQGLDRFITATSKNPGTPQVASTEIDGMPSSRSGTSRRARLRHKSSRGLAVVKRFLRHGRSQLGQSSLDEEGKQTQSTAAAGDVQDPAPADAPKIPDDWAPHIAAVNESAIRTSSPKEPSDPRKVSDKTVLSEFSDKSTMTVCRRPSRRVSSPITTVDSSYIYPTEFEGPKPVTVSRSYEPDLHAHPPRVSSSVYSDDFSSHDVTLSTHPSQRSSGQMIYQRSPPPKSNLSLETLSQRLFSDVSTQSGQYRQQRAAREFNRLASSHRLYPLILRENSVSVASK